MPAEINLFDDPTWQELLVELLVNLEQYLEGLRTAKEQGFLIASVNRWREYVTFRGHGREVNVTYELLKDPLALKHFFEMAKNKPQQSPDGNQ